MYEAVADRDRLPRRNDTSDTTGLNCAPLTGASTAMSTASSHDGAFGKMPFAGRCRFATVRILYNCNATRTLSAPKLLMLASIVGLA
jgi:hypothetical protein